MKELLDNKQIEFHYFMLLNFNERFKTIAEKYKVYKSLSRLQDESFSEIDLIVLSGLMFPCIVDKYDKNSIMQLSNYIYHDIFEHSLTFKQMGLNRYYELVDSINNKITDIFKNPPKQIPSSITAYFMTFLFDNLNELVEDNRYAIELDSLYKELVMNYAGIIGSFCKGLTTFM